jgi:hypothetical protein
MCSVSPRSSFWPWGFVIFASNRRHRCRAPPSGSRPCGLICFGEPRWSSRPSSWVIAVAPHRRVGWMAICNPDVAAMLYSAARLWERCCPLAVAASGWWPRCHNCGCPVVSPPWSSALLLCEHSCEFLLLLLVSVCFLWWPGQWATHACLCCCHAMLLLLSCSSLCCCCCPARAPLLVTVYCYCEFQCKC